MKRIMAIVILTLAMLVMALTISATQSNAGTLHEETTCECPASPDHSHHMIPVGEPVVDILNDVIMIEAQQYQCIYCDHNEEVVNYTHL